jgi:protein SCO1/2
MNSGAWGGAVSEARRSGLLRWINKPKMRTKEPAPAGFRRRAPSCPGIHAGVWVAALASCLVVGAADARAQQWREENAGTPNTTPPELTGVEIDEHLGGPLPRDASLRDAEGRGVKLGDYFDGKRPTLFVFAYHTCPMLCSLVLDAVVRSLNDVGWTVGDQFDVVSLSIDPRDTPETATRKRAQIVDSYARARARGATNATRGWHFLVGDEGNIRRVTEAIGFKYSYDARQKQYAHPAAMYLLTPQGRIARYLYGIQYEPNDVRLGLLEASEGRSISTTEKVLMSCYRYDPQGKHYTLVAMNVMRLGGVVTIAGLGGFLTIMWARERRLRKLRSASPAPTKPLRSSATSP